ncbi:DUF4364 family protein [Caldanaerobius polysaccharolyticus]|uniref:DUF4364 family protein n=1 Tax=Caldanaerobius polysaccharolyticus TaxID=44256 RepID=UPI00047AF919|nr:DUF4364 family protein [Caldanaerobius polysaccharolyticus]
MINSTQELAENKLLILYVLQRAGLPLSNEQISEIMMDTESMNYFLLQQFLGELQSSEHLFFDTKKSCYYITPKGTNTLNLFLHLIDEDKRKRLDRYIVINRERFKRELQITADYKQIAKDQFIVTCKVEENNITLIELKLNVVTKEQAKLLCSKWNNKAQKIYANVIRELTEDENIDKKP